MKKIMLLILCAGLSLSASNAQRVRVIKGACKGHEGYVIGKMKINLRIETHELVALLLSSDKPHKVATPEQQHELTCVINEFKKQPDHEFPLVYLVCGEKSCGVFDEKSIEEIKE